MQDIPDTPFEGGPSSENMAAVELALNKLDRNEFDYIVIRRQKISDPYAVANLEIEGKYE